VRLAAEVSSGPVPEVGLGRRALLATAVLGCAGVLAWQLWPEEVFFDTGVGEQRLVLLPDGTRMTLNTSTRVNVALTDARRAVNVQRGEALFEVAKEPGRPFIVRVADVDVTATGTVFLVRSTPEVRRDGSFGVTLIEGQVVVRGAGGRAEGEFGDPVVLAPGQRLRLGAEAASVGRARLDRPRIDQIAAWQRGEIVLDNVPLTDAVAEMNRYSRLPIALIGGEAIGSLRVSGVFRTRGSEAFARAVAALHDLGFKASDSGFQLFKR
jgi:transmembrane sensor